VRAFNRRRAAAGLDRLSASADSSGSPPRRRSSFRCLRWVFSLLLRFGLVALLITAGALFIDSDQTSDLRKDGHSGVTSAVAWGKDAGARGLGQLGVACRCTGDCFRSAWINPAPTQAVDTAGLGDSAGGGGIELNSVHTGPAARATDDSAPKSR